MERNGSAFRYLFLFPRSWKFRLLIQESLTYLHWKLLVIFRDMHTKDILFNLQTICFNLTIAIEIREFENEAPIHSKVFSKHVHFKKSWWKTRISYATQNVNFSAKLFLQSLILLALTDVFSSSTLQCKAWSMILVGCICRIVDVFLHYWRLPFSYASIQEFMKG